MMHRTNVCLPETTYQAVKLIANMEQATIAKKLRQFVQEGVDKTLTKSRNRRKHYLELLGEFKIKGGPKDDSVNHDKSV